MPIKPELMEILVCPICQGQLAEEEDTLICKKCCLSFPIIEGIPVLLVEKARKIYPENKQ